jgi:hypothetical protein
MITRQQIRASDPLVNLAEEIQTEQKNGFGERIIERETGAAKTARGKHRHVGRSSDE